MAERVPLVLLAPGKEAVVVDIRAGWGLVRRLEALGIRVGQRVEKVSGPFVRGPVTVRIGNIRAAIGFGVAAKVIVEVEVE